MQADGGPEVLGGIPGNRLQIPEAASGEQFWCQIVLVDVMANSSPGLVVLGGGGSCPEGREFESQHLYLLAMF